MFAQLTNWWSWQNKRTCSSSPGHWSHTREPATFKPRCSTSRVCARKRSLLTLRITCLDRSRWRYCGTVVGICSILEKAKTHTATHHTHTHTYTHTRKHAHTHATFLTPRYTLQAVGCASFVLWVCSVTTRWLICMYNMVLKMVCTDAFHPQECEFVICFAWVWCQFLIFTPSLHAWGAHPRRSNHYHLALHKFRSNMVYLIKVSESCACCAQR